MPWHTRHHTSVHAGTAAAWCSRGRWSMSPCPLGPTGGRDCRAAEHCGDRRAGPPPAAPVVREARHRPRRPGAGQRRGCLPDHGCCPEGRVAPKGFHKQRPLQSRAGRALIERASEHPSCRIKMCLRKRGRCIVEYIKNDSQSPAPGRTQGPGLAGGQQACCRQPGVVRGAAEALVRRHHGGLLCKSVSSTSEKLARHIGKRS